MMCSARMILLGLVALQSYEADALTAAGMRSAANLNVVEKGEAVVRTATTASTSQARDQGFQGNAGLPRTVPEMRRMIMLVGTPLLTVALALICVGGKVEGRLGYVCSLLGCITGLCISWVGYGILQEAIMIVPYASGPFPSAVFLVAANRLMAVIVAFFVVKVIQRKSLGLSQGGNAVRMACLLPALTNVAASWLQFASLWYITFPTQMLFKSAKIVPVMVFGKLMLGKSYEALDYAEALMIVGGIASFTWFAEGLGAGHLTPLLGAVLLTCFLVCEMLTPSLQKRAFTGTSLDAFQINFIVGVICLAYALVMLACSGETISTLHFLLANPRALEDVVLLSSLSAVGQVFIYMTVKEHSPGALAFVMTARQVISLILSCAFFGHHIGNTAIAAASVVLVVNLGKVICGERVQESKEPKLPLTSKDGNCKADTDAEDTASTASPASPRCSWPQSVASTPACSDAGSDAGSDASSASRIREAYGLSEDAAKHLAQKSQFKSIVQSALVSARTR